MSEHETIPAAVLDAALEGYGEVSFEAYEAGADFDHEIAMRAALTAALPALRAEVLAPVAALFARYEEWTGDPDYEWKSSPKQRDELRAALAASDADAAQERDARIRDAALASAVIAVHIRRLEADSDTFSGPDSFYAGICRARHIIRELMSPSAPNPLASVARDADR